MMAAKTSQAIRDEILRLWRAGGYTHAVLAREFGITRTTIRGIVEPSYAETRREQIRARRRGDPPESRVSTSGKKRPISLAAV